MDYEPQVGHFIRCEDFSKHPDCWVEGEVHHIADNGLMTVYVARDCWRGVIRTEYGELGSRFGVRMMVPLPGQHVLEWPTRVQRMTRGRLMLAAVIGLQWRSEEWLNAANKEAIYCNNNDIWGDPGITGFHLLTSEGIFARRIGNDIQCVKLENMIGDGEDWSDSWTVPEGHTDHAALDVILYYCDFDAVCEGENL